eukprot:2822883-Pyramimonas_sp.AAC.1
MLIEQPFCLDDNILRQSRHDTGLSSCLPLSATPSGVELLPPMSRNPRQARSATLGGRRAGSEH